MKTRIKIAKKKKGLTLIELLIGSSILLVVVLATLALYVRSNRITVDHQQYAELQHDVRSAMFFISRDIRSAGVGLTVDIAGYFLEGRDAYSPGDAGADSIKLMGNFDDPLNLIIRKYQGGVGGGAATAFLYEWSLENSPYDCPEFYEKRVVLVISTRCPGCFTFRYIPNNGVYGCGQGTEHFNMQPGQSELNPPGGLIDTGCSENCWDDAIITIAQIKLYWLDTTGNPGDYPELNLSVGTDGYLGIPDVLYLTTVGEGGDMMHMPLAQNIENLQFQYNGDLDDDGNLDGFTDWNISWTPNEILRLRQVRIWILGRTPSAFVSVGGRRVPSGIHLYRRPAIANSPASSQDDMHRRFLLDSTANIRNMSLNIYNTGTR